MSNSPSPTLLPHEALELHELMRSETIALKKLQLNLNLVDDTELKEYMEDCRSSKQATLDEYEQLLFKSQHQRLPKEE